MKLCTTCGQWVPLEQMIPNRRSKDGRSNLCRSCKRDRQVEWAQRNPERAAEIARASKERNRDRARALAREWEARHPERVYWNRIWSTYRVTKQWYEDTLAAQGGGCAICGDGESTLCFDHDHSCCPGSKSCGRCVRGLLCMPCNVTLHAMEKRPGWADAAATYLAVNRSDVAGSAVVLAKVPT